MELITRERAFEGLLMYFSSFPKIVYDSKGQGRPKVVTNLFRRVAIRTKVKDNAMLYDTYDIKNGDTPEVSHINSIMTQNYIG